MLLNCLLQHVQGTQGMRNTDLDKEAKGEDLLLHSQPRNWLKKSKVFWAAAPYCLGDAGWALPQGKESSIFKPLLYSLLGREPRENCYTPGLVPMAKHLEGDLAASCLCWVWIVPYLKVGLQTSSWCLRKASTFTFGAPHSVSWSWPNVDMCIQEKNCTSTVQIAGRIA